MGPSRRERDGHVSSVFVEVMASTYHRPRARPRACARALAGLACVLAATLLGAASARATTLVIEGAGNGHGVGMSQDGALGYAQHGASYEAILAHYYTATTLGQVPARSVVRVLEGSRVVRVPIERYVRGVVAAEMPASWPLAALEAQAVASRTYALTAHAGGSRFDVYSDTRSQVYMGVAAETASTNAAVRATAGQIVLFDGKPATTYFFASSGGMTENVENSFLGSQPEPWLRGVPDAHEGKSAAWRLSLSFAAAAARLQGLLKGSLRGIEVLTRGVSPRIVSARILGSGGATPVTGPQLAGAFGLSSTWAYFSVKNGATLRREPDRSGHAPASTAPAAPAPPATVAPTSPTAPPGPQGGTPAPPAGVSASAGGVSGAAGGVLAE